MSETPYTLEKLADDNYRDQHGVSHRTPAAWLGNILGVCGCGRGDDIERRALEILDIFAGQDNWEYRNVFFDKLVNETIAHWLDSVGLLEHGTIFRGSWLTDAGKQVHEQIHQFDFPNIEPDAPDQKP